MIDPKQAHEILSGYLKEYHPPIKDKVIYTRFNKNEVDEFTFVGLVKIAYNI